MAEGIEGMRRTIVFGAFAVTTCITACVSTAQTTSEGAVETSEWQEEQRTDPLRGAAFSQFSLAGKFLTAPRNSPNTHPLMVVRCTRGKDHHGHTNGKFLSGYIFVGGVVDSHITDSGDSAVSVQFRLDDGKLQTKEDGMAS